jgi:hypothetical protein
MESSDMTDEERFSIHRILGIGMSEESMLLIKLRIAEVEARGYSSQLKELLADPEPDPLVLSRFLCINLDPCRDPRFRPWAVDEQ